MSRESFESWLASIYDSKLNQLNSLIEKAAFENFKRTNEKKKTEPK